MPNSRLDISLRTVKIEIFVCKTANMPTCGLHHDEGCQGLRQFGCYVFVESCIRA